MLAQHNIEKRLVNANVAFVFDVPFVLNVAHVSESVHEEADARAGCSDHLCEGFLGDRRNERLRLSRLSVISHEQQYPCQTPLAGVKELVDQVGLSSYSSCDHELDEKIRETRFLM